MNHLTHCFHTQILILHLDSGQFYANPTRSMNPKKLLVTTCLDRGTDMSINIEKGEREASTSQKIGKQIRNNIYFLSK